ncbi:MAG: hypothetical protein LUI06_07305 [Ruminococcus sp.]|nr:hypothetical protein [Ruminococcus sp.]
MRKYFLEYFAFLDAAMNDENTDFVRLMKIHKEKTRYFMHERAIHLLVMILVALCTLSSFLVAAVTEMLTLIPLVVLFLGLLVPYIAHYYFLENNTQKLYTYYDRICEKIEGEEL